MATMTAGGAHGRQPARSLCATSSATANMGEAYSERRVAAAGTRATDLAGGSATSAATSRVAGITNNTGSGVIASVGRPAWLANSCQAHRPPAMPSGTPTTSATAVTVATCQN